MSSICEKLTISEPICVAESYAVSSLNNDSMIYGNKALMVYFGIFLVVFVLALLIGYTNSSAAYYGLIKPSWALSLTTWTFLLALVFFFTAFAASKMQLGSRRKSHWYSIFFVVSILLMLFFVFFIFQMNNFRIAFWILVASAVLLVVTMFSGWNSYRMASTWLIPLLLLEVALLVETWQIISLNNL
jgi:tryptophan-rich sensory protein